MNKSKLTRLNSDFEVKLIFQKYLSMIQKGNFRINNYLKKNKFLKL